MRTLGLAGSELLEIVRLAAADALGCQRSEIDVDTVLVGSPGFLAGPEVFPVFFCILMIAVYLQYCICLPIRVLGGSCSLNPASSLRGRNSRLGFCCCHSPCCKVIRRTQNRRVRKISILILLMSDGSCEDYFKTSEMAWRFIG